MVRARSGNFPSNDSIVERIGFAADNLTSFMPLPGNDQQVARIEIGYRSRNRLAAVADLNGVRGLPGSLTSSQTAINVACGAGNAPPAAGSGARTSSSTGASPSAFADSACPAEPF